MVGLRRWRGAGLVVGGIALGVLVSVGATQVLGGDDNSAEGAIRSADVPTTSLLDPSQLAEVDGERLRTETARDAVEQFLQAVQDRDAERSFALLADAQRLDYGSTAAWAADPDAVPEVLGFEVEQAAADEGGAPVVTTLTRYRSSLDSVGGFVPARARTAWAVVREDGGWAVDLDATTQQPLLPPDDDAAAAARDWAAGKQACEPDETALRGQTSLAEALCGADGEVAVGIPAPLSPLDAGALSSSLGGDASAWARTVDVSGPAPVRVVLAPLADRWTVVAALAPPGAGR